MRLRHVQSLQDMLNFYDKVIQVYDSGYDAEPLLLHSWGLTGVSKSMLREERLVVVYLLNINNHSRGRKPDKEVALRSFTRYLTFLQKTNSVDDFTISKYRGKSVYKKYKACTHYLFKFSLPAWYRDLP